MKIIGFTILALKDRTATERAMDFIRENIENVDRAEFGENPVVYLRLGDKTKLSVKRSHHGKNPKKEEPKTATKVEEKPKAEAKPEVDDDEEEVEDPEIESPVKMAPKPRTPPARDRRPH